MNRNATPQEKREAVEKLGKLLECAGTALPWEDVVRGFYRIPTPILNSLVYCVERARAQAFEEGREHNA
jgi:hypothetical protein